MQKLSLLLILICSFFFTNIDAQIIPGYQGKRFLGSVSLGYGPATFGPTKNGKSIGENGNIFVLNTRLKLSANYAIARKVSLRLEHDRYQTAFWDDSVEFGNTFFDALNQVKVQSIGLGVDFCASVRGTWGLAPLGFSYGFTVEYGTASTELGFKHPDGLSENYKNAAKEQIVFDDFRYGVLGFKMMTRKVVADKIVLITGFNSGLLLNTLIKPFGLLIEGENREERNPAELRLLRHSLFQLEIGVGYLIF